MASGEEVWKALARKVAAAEQAKHPGFVVRNPTDASQALREAGIPGIKYLDQGSRNTVKPPELVTKPDGTQAWATRSATGVLRHFSSKEAAQKFWQEAEDRGRTHNYVVFDDKLIDILKKYGLAGLVAGGAAHYKTTQVDHDPFQ
jgi:hypothetical protein